jgi:hypothetical protein
MRWMPKRLISSSLSSVVMPEMAMIRPQAWAARGFRNFANYRTRILFFCGKFDIRPAISHSDS